MQRKNNGFYRLLYLVAAFFLTLKKLWKNSKQVPTFPDNDSDVYRKIRMLKPIDASMEAELLALSASSVIVGDFDDSFDFLEFVQLELKGIDIVYAFDRKYEIISCPAFEEEAIATANRYVYAYDQRRENMRKLGKPSLGLSPPIYS
jgi:hypothetical protein